MKTRPCRRLQDRGTPVEVSVEKGGGPSSASTSRLQSVPFPREFPDKETRNPGVPRSWSLRQGRADFSVQLREASGRVSWSIGTGPVSPENNSAFNQGPSSIRVPSPRRSGFKWMSSMAAQTVYSLSRLRSSLKTGERHLVSMLLDVTELKFRSWCFRRGSVEDTALSKTPRPWYPCRSVR